MIVFHSDLLLRRRISFSQPQPPPSLPPATFREALLRPKTTDFEAHEADLPAGGNPAGNQKHTHRQARLFSCSLPSTRRRVSARVGACFLLQRRDSTHRVVRRRLGVLSLRRSNPSPPSPPFGPFLPPPSASVHLQSLQFIFIRFSSSSVSFSSSSVVFSTVWVPFFFIFKLHSRDSPSY